MLQNFGEFEDAIVQAVFSVYRELKAEFKQEVQVKRSGNLQGTRLFSKEDLEEDLDFWEQFLLMAVLMNLRGMRLECRSENVYFPAIWGQEGEISAEKVRE